MTLEGSFGERLCQLEEELATPTSSNSVNLHKPLLVMECPSDYSTRMDCLLRALRDWKNSAQERARSPFFLNKSGILCSREDAMIVRRFHDIAVKPHNVRD